MLIRRIGAFFLDILQVLVFAVAIFLFVYLLILQPHKIKGDSMQPNYPDGEYLLTDKVSYRFGEPERGDIVVFEPPNSNGDEFIKRIIGLPGESVSISSGKFLINSSVLNEAYIDSSIRTDGGAYLGENKQLIIPEDHYFVLGDNRSHSSDSRIWGFVPIDNITGKAWLIYWPPDNAGTITDPVYAL